MIGLVFTPEQFKTLLRMVYVANTIANGNRDEDLLKEYDDLEQYVFSRAGAAGLPAAVWRHEVEGEEHHHPSRVFESDTELNTLMDEYDMSTAYEFIAEKLAERDINEEFGPRAEDRMPAKDFETLLEERAETYAAEFAAHGLKNLALKKPSEA
jgi:hypothetical protein